LSLLCGEQKRHNPINVKYWEVIADNLSKAGWSWGCVSALDSRGRTIWIADARRGDGKRFIVRADEKLRAFLELQRVTRESFRFPDAEWFGTILACSLLIAFPWKGQEIDCKLQSNYS